MIELDVKQDTVVEGACSDCGMIVPARTRCLDRSTASYVDLCASCLPAFRQREQFTAGCCG